MSDEKFVEAAQRLGLSVEAVQQASDMDPTEAARFLGQPIEVMQELFGGTGPGDYPDGTVMEVLTLVDGDPDRAQHALDIENGKDEPRKTLVEKLQKIVEQEEDSDEG